MGSKSSKRIKVNAELAKRAKLSYGMWSVLAEFLDRLEFLKMQQLDHYLYTTAISRVQTRWTLRDPVHFIFKPEGDVLLWAYKANTEQMLPVLIDDLNPGDPSSYVQVGDETLYYFAQKSVQRIEINLEDGSHNRKKVCHFSMRVVLCETYTNYQDESIYITGGQMMTKNLQLSKEVKVLDLKTHQLVNAPDLNIARSLHSGTVLGSNLYVFGGLCGPGSMLTTGTIEVLKIKDSPNENWQLIGDIINR